MLFCVRAGGGGGAETDRQKDRQTDRDTERHTERDRVIEAEKDRDRERRERERERERGERERERERERGGQRHVWLAVRRSASKQQQDLVCTRFAFPYNSLIMTLSPPSIPLSPPPQLIRQ